MQTIQIEIPDEIALLINTFSQPKEEFVLEAIEEKIRREKGKVKLAERGISEEEALTQRAAFATFSEDWESPEMDVYDLIELSTPTGKQSGLLSDSLIATDNLATLHEKFIDRKLGSLPDLNEVEKALAHTLGLILKD
ncbi:MAG TPA: hypothetical protein VF644_13055 [Pyrinomonadaceae bacterium]|jgi:hypothetical protein